MESNSLLTGPFTFETLLLQLLMTIILLLSGFAILWVSSGRSNAANAIAEATWNIITSFNLQGCSIVPTTVSQNALFISTFVFFVLTHYMYSAFLLSVLSSTKNPIRSLPQLLSRGYTVESTSSLTDYIKGKAVPNTKKLGITTNSLGKVFEGGHIHIGHSHTDFLDFYYNLMDTPVELQRKICSLKYPSNLYSGFYISKEWTQKLREPLNRRCEVGRFMNSSRFDCVLL